MKFYHGDGESGVTFSDRDRDIARAAAEAVDSVVDLAETVGLTGTGECEACGADARLRPFALVDDGTVWAAGLCADCQAAKVASKLDDADADEDVGRADA